MAKRAFLTFFVVAVAVGEVWAGDCAGDCFWQYCSGPDPQGNKTMYQTPTGVTGVSVVAGGSNQPYAVALAMGYPGAFEEFDEFEASASATGWTHTESYMYGQSECAPEDVCFPAPAKRFRLTGYLQYAWYTTGDAHDPRWFHSDGRARVTATASVSLRGDGSDCQTQPERSSTFYLEYEAHEDEVVTNTGSIGFPSGLTIGWESQSSPPTWVGEGVRAGASIFCMWWNSGEPPQPCGSPVVSAGAAVNVYVTARVQNNAVGCFVRLEAKPEAFLFEMLP